MRYKRDAAEFDRAIAFIDATYAVALTLLVTSLDIDDVPSAFDSVSSLADAVGPQFLAFLIAFAVISGYWLLHHRMVANWVAIDTQTIVVNLFLIAAVVLLPFSTVSVGDPEAADLVLPTVLMAVNIAAVSSLHLLVRIMAARRDLLDHPVSPAEFRNIVIGGLAPPAVFLASVPVAYLVSPDAARYFWLLLIVVNPAVGVLIARSGPPKPER